MCAQKHENSEEGSDGDAAHGGDKVPDQLEGVPEGAEGAEASPQSPLMAPSEPPEERSGLAAVRPCGLEHGHTIACRTEENGNH